MPHRARRLPGPAPAGLIHVHRAGAAQALQQIGVGLGQRTAPRGSGSPRPCPCRSVRRTALRRAPRRRGGRCGCAPTASPRRPAGAARRRCPPPRAGSSPRVSSPQPGQRTRWARCSLTLHRDQRQLLHLPAHRLAGRHALLLGEIVPAAAALRPVLDRPRRPRRRAEVAPVPSCPAGRPACDPTSPCHAAAARRADRRSAAERSCARSGLVVAPAARSARPAARTRAVSASTCAVNPFRKTSTSHHHLAALRRRSPPPPRAPRLTFDSAELCPPDQLNAYAFRRARPADLQAGGHRFDPGWLHRTKRLLIARFLAVAFALDWDR